MAHVRSSYRSLVPGSDRHLGQLDNNERRGGSRGERESWPLSEEGIRGLNVLLELGTMPQIKVDCFLVASGIKELYASLLKNDVKQIDLVADQIFEFLSSKQDHAMAFSTLSGFIDASFKQKVEYREEPESEGKKLLDDFIDGESSGDTTAKKYDSVQPLVYVIDPNPDVFIEELRSMAKSDADLQLIKILPEIVFERAAEFNPQNRIKIAAAACSEAEWQRYFGRLDYFKQPWPINIHYATTRSPSITRTIKAIKDRYIQETFSVQPNSERYKDENRIRMSDEVMRDPNSLYYGSGVARCSDYDNVIDVKYTRK